MRSGIEMPVNHIGQLVGNINFRLWRASVLNSASRGEEDQVQVINYVGKFHQ